MCIASVVTTNVANNTNALLLMEYVYGPRLQNVVYGKLQNVLLRKILITFGLHFCFIFQEEICTYFM